MNDNKLKIVQCNRCMHEWATRLKRPAWCSKCHSPYWDKERIKRKKKRKQ